MINSGFAMTFYYTVLVILISTNFTLGNDEIEELRPKRDGMVGLFPFPRVGRSDPDLIQEWDGSDFSLNSNEDYGELVHREVKRQGLIPFPRVGRSGAMKYWPKAIYKEMVKRAGNGVGANSGMWFGPRLGKVQKRNSFKDNQMQANKSPTNVYTPRLEDESEQIFNDEYDNYFDSLPKSKTIVANNY